MKKIYIEVKGKVKRFFYSNFKRATVEKLLKERKGECLQCGSCCEILFKCPYLWTSDGKKRCLIYHLGRPKQCKAFPLFPEDIKSVNLRCGYFFEK